MRFRKVTSGRAGSRKSGVDLIVDNWDDYTFKTLFSVVYFDEAGTPTRIGSVKIGYVGQEGGRTSAKLPEQFEELPPGFFSLGQDVEYYVNLSSLPPEIRNQYLDAMRDIAADSKRLAEAKREDVYKTSLLRSVGESLITGQFARILGGGAILTDYKFEYRGTGATEGFVLSFEVEPDSTPPTNIHVLIGRNGVGKTTILNRLIDLIMRPGTSGSGELVVTDSSEFLPSPKPLPEGYFSSVTSVSFSAFDPFVPPPDQVDRSKGITYFYVGLKKYDEGTASESIKRPTDIRADFVSSLITCLSQESKLKRWRRAIQALEFDENFAEMRLTRFADEVLSKKELSRLASGAFAKMSSGHQVVLLTVTKLVETVEEKSLVLMDEPESHLHPPLLSAFTRALSDLLTSRNAVAIIATHSPVVLQEVPASCVWKIRRFRSASAASRPEVETFAENVGVLTREVFGLEVTKSGFHDLLRKDAAAGLSFDEILRKYKSQIGYEGQAVLRAMLSSAEQKS